MPTAGSLDGVKVVDLSRVLGGPYCTQILGDHGADILKVEPPAGDETRHWGPSYHDRGSSYFLGVNRNKRSIGLDLSSERGREILFQFLAGADVLVENFKPGTLEKWGLGYDAVLKDRFPGLVHCSISGFGENGPVGGRPGYDAIAQAMVGMMSINGDDASGPTRVGIPVVDLATGLYCVIGILMALLERQRSGLGQRISVSLFDTGLSIMHPHIANYQYSGLTPGLEGSRHPNISPYDKFETRTGPIFLGAGNDRSFERLCNELGRPELASDRRFKSNNDRLKNRGELTDVLASVLANHDGDSLTMRLLDVGITAGPVWTAKQAILHEQTKHNEMCIESDWYRGTGSPIKLSRNAASTRMTPPAFGQHSREILTDNGYTQDAIDQLSDDKIVYEAPDDTEK